MTLRRAGVDGVILYFGETIDPHIHAQVMACQKKLQQYLGHGIVTLLPSYASLWVQYSPLRWDEATVLALLETTCQSPMLHPDASDAMPLLTLPVWYDPHVGWDIETVARQHNMEPDEVIRRHHAPEYRVYAIGFQPGFGYMGQVDPAIATPRLATPRTAIPAGSVALADTQTAVYPAESPGGWHILGRTPTRLFDCHRSNPSLLRVGMRIRFVPIDRARYLDLGGAL